MSRQVKEGKELFKASSGGDKGEEDYEKEESENKESDEEQSERGRCGGWRR